MVAAPIGWHAVWFRVSSGPVASTGPQLSNVPLPAPTLVSSSAIQVNGQLLAPRGVRLIIATDADPTRSRSPYSTPPLHYPRGWTIGSALAGNPYIELLWIRGNGQSYLAAAKIGPEASGTDLKALARIVDSFSL